MTGLTFGNNKVKTVNKNGFNVSSIEKYFVKRDSASKPLWCDIPILIAQLPKHKIFEDLDILFKVFFFFNIF